MQDAAGQGARPAEREHRLDQLGRAAGCSHRSSTPATGGPRLTLDTQASRSVRAVRTKPGWTPRTAPLVLDLALASTSVSLATPAFAAAKADTCAPSWSPRLPYTIRSCRALAPTIRPTRGPGAGEHVVPRRLIWTRHDGTQASGSARLQRSQRAAGPSAGNRERHRAQVRHRDRARRNSPPPPQRSHQRRIPVAFPGWADSSAGRSARRWPGPERPPRRPARPGATRPAGRIPRLARSRTAT